MSPPSLGQPLIVVGMHRSGTSMVAGALRAAGFYFGQEDALFPPDDRNPEGYWELAAFSQMNDRIRRDLDMAFNPCLNLPNDWAQYEHIGNTLKDLRALIEKTFNGHPHWALKDPRISLLMPLYDAVFSQSGIDPSWVLCVRNPLNVAASVWQRDAIPHRPALGLWLQHTLHALAGSIGRHRRVVLYEDFLVDPAERLRDILSLCPDLASWPPVAGLAKASLDHGPNNRDEIAKLAPSLIPKTYEICRLAAGNSAALNSGAFDDEILELSGELESIWSLSPSYFTLSSAVVLTWQEGAETRSVDRGYVPASKPQAVEVAFDAPQGTPIFVSLSLIPGQVVIKKASLTNDKGAVTPLNLMAAKDIPVASSQMGAVWTLPRSGQHARFISPGGKQRLSIALFTKINPPELARIMTETWNERNYYKGRVEELEERLKSK